MARRSSAVGGPNPPMVKVPASRSAARARQSSSGPSASKAKAILSDGEVRGNPLTAPQKGRFGAIAGGGPRPGIGGSASSKRTSPRSPAIGQRPTLGARTKNAMMPKVRSRN